MPATPSIACLDAPEMARDLKHPVVHRALGRAPQKAPICTKKKRIGKTQKFELVLRRFLFNDKALNLWIDKSQLSSSSLLSSTAVPEPTDMP